MEAPTTPTDFDPEQKRYLEGPARAVCDCACWLTSKSYAPTQRMI
jgi:hypothetical protein